MFLFHSIFSLRKKKRNIKKIVVNKNRQNRIEDRQNEINQTGIDLKVSKGFHQQ